MEVAHYLQSHPAIERVNYNGLPDHPDYAVSAKQMRHPGPMLSMELKGGMEAGKRFIDQLQMCTRAVSLGTLDTLLSHPASMTHYGLTREERERFSITDGLIRISVGIENVADILNDLEQALR
jgi:methionine-gamma-lyase